MVIFYRKNDKELFDLTGENKNTQEKTYEKTYEKDVPADFLLDTYYLKLEEDESVDVLVTFVVTDSTGNTTEEEIPVKVKYNHYPEISSEDTFYYLKEEANRGEITGEALIGRAQARDEEDGDVTAKLALKDFDPQALKMQEGSTWRKPENFAYLKRILRNGTPMETWDFSHEDVLAVQDWITEDGQGRWKVGQEANRQFLAKFVHCKQ